MLEQHLFVAIIVDPISIYNFKDRYNYLELLLTRFE